jgi:hypothetical protein
MIRKPIRKYIKQKETQVDHMKTLARIIIIVVTYAFLVEDKSLLNKKSTNHKEIKNKNHTLTYDLTSNTLFHLVWINYWVQHIWMEGLQCLVFSPTIIKAKFLM